MSDKEEKKVKHKGKTKNIFTIGNILSFIILLGIIILFLVSRFLWGC